MQTILSQAAKTKTVRRKVQRLSRKGVGSKWNRSAERPVEGRKDSLSLLATARDWMETIQSQHRPNYADYLNISTYALQTAIDPALEALGVQAAYRLAQVVNMILQNEADGANNVDPLVGHLSKTGTDTVETVDITAAVQSLQGVNALPFEDGRYFGVVHPFTVGDVLSDRNFNSLVDVVKRTAAGNERLKELPAPDGDAVTVLDWGGATFFQSTFVHMTPNYSGSGVTGFRTYIFGRDGVISISFGARENTQVGDGNWRNLNVWIRRLTEPSGYDPSRMIGGFASYNAMFTATLPPDTVMRLRWIDAVSAIS